MDAPLLSVVGVQIMDYSALPHFCHKGYSGPSNHLENYSNNCFSWDHPFHQQLYNYINEQSVKKDFTPEGATEG